MTKLILALCTFLLISLVTSSIVASPSISLWALNSRSKQLDTPYSVSIIPPSSREISQIGYASYTINVARTSSSGQFVVKLSTISSLPELNGLTTFSPTVINFEEGQFSKNSTLTVGTGVMHKFPTGTYQFKVKAISLKSESGQTRLNSNANRQFNINQALSNTGLLTVSSSAPPSTLSRSKAPSSLSTDSAVGSHILSQQEQQNSAPVARAGRDQVVREGETVILDGGASFDPDKSDRLFFSWIQQSPLSPVVVIDQNSSSLGKAIFKAPEVEQDTKFIFKLVVNDGRGGEATDSVNLVVANKVQDRSSSIINSPSSFPPSIPSSSSSSVSQMQQQEQQSKPTPTQQLDQSSAQVNNGSKSLLPVNHPPVAQAATMVTAQQNKPISFTLKASDPDKNDKISFIIVSNPLHGILVGFDKSTGGLTYIPVTNYIGQDSFKFKVSDLFGKAESNQGIVSIVVSAQNPQQLSKLSGSSRQGEPTTQSINGSLNASSVISLSPNSTRSVSLNGTNAKSSLSSSVPLPGTDKLLKQLEASKIKKVNGETVPGQYIIVLKSNLSATKALLLANEVKAKGAKLLHTYQKALKGYSISAVNNQVLDAILNTSDVLYAEPDLKLKAQAMAQQIPTGIDRVDADLSSSLSGDGKGTVDADIAILDTGIDLTHPDLNVYKEVTFVPGTTTGNDDSDGGHGTMVAGIAAAKDNDIGVVGVAPGARLWSVKVLDQSGVGSLSSVLEGLDYIAQHANEIDVADMSFGCENCSSQSLNTAISNAVSAGVVVVAAAGNSGRDASNFLPASNPDVLAVSAIADSDGKCGSEGQPTPFGADDNLASFSNYGPIIDLAAPGVNILSTGKGNSYSAGSGTSMAAPHVAGAAALYKSENPSSSPAQIKDALQKRGSTHSAACKAADGNNNNGGYGYFSGDKDNNAEPLLYMKFGNNNNASISQPVNPGNVTRSNGNLTLTGNVTGSEGNHTLIGNKTGNERDNSKIFTAYSADSVIATIPVGSDPQGVAVSQAGNTYVTNFASGTVSVINSTNALIATIPVGPNPRDIAYDSQNGNIYVVHQPTGGGGSVSVIDTSTNSVIASIGIGNPTGITTNSNQGDVYVGQFSPAGISVIDGETNTVSGRIPTPAPVNQIIFDPANLHLYAGLTNGPEDVAVIDPATHNITKIIDLPGAGHLWGIAFLPEINSDTRIIQADQGSNTVYLINDFNNSLSTTVPSVSSATGVAVNLANGKIYVTNFQNPTGEVTVIDPPTFSISGTIPVRSLPIDIDFNPENGNMYVANSGNDSVSVICTVSSSCPSIAITSVNDTSPKWGFGVRVDGTVTAANTGDTVSIDWGDATTGEPPVQIQAGGLWTATHIYGPSAVGPRNIVANLLEGTGPNVRASSAPFAITVLKHSTSLSLVLPSEIVANTRYTAVGTLLDTGFNPPVQIPTKQISFIQTAGVPPLPTATTEGITFDPGPLPNALQVVSCSSCTSESGTGTGNVVGHMITNSEIRPPAGTTGLRVTFDGMGTTPFTYVITKGDSTTVTETSSGLGSIPNTLSREFGEGIKSIKFTSIGSNGPGDFVSISSVATFDRFAVPQEQHVVDFENLTPGTQVVGGKTLVPDSGSYYSIATATTSSGTKVDTQASFTPPLTGAGSEYLGSNSGTVTSLILDNQEGTAGEPVTPISYQGTIYNLLAPGSQVNVPVSAASSGAICSGDQGGDSDNDGICDKWESSSTSGNDATSHRYIKCPTSSGAFMDGFCTSPTAKYNLCFKDQFSDVWGNKAANSIICPTVGHKDLYVEIDYMANHLPDTNAIKDVIKAFGNGPVTGNTASDAFGRPGGVTLHVIVDEQIARVSPITLWQNNPDNGVYNDDFKSIEERHFGLLNSPTRIDANNPADERTACPSNAPCSIDTIRANLPLLLKHYVTRYGLWISNWQGTTQTNCGPSGQAETLGNDFVVSLGCNFSGTDPAGGTVGSRDEQAGTFMHELGHTLNLAHGGPSISSFGSSNYNDNCKPNQLSVMSYTRQVPWGTVITPSVWETNHFLDYSRAAVKTRVTNLDPQEGTSTTPSSGLNEPNGLAGAGLAVYGTPSRTVQPVRTAGLGAGIDWDGSGPVSGTVFQDVNNFGISGCGPSIGSSPNGQVHKSMDEWNSLSFYFLNDVDSQDGNYGDVRQTPEITGATVQKETKAANRFSGFLQPINPDGSSIFNSGSTIPAKFQLRDANGNFITNAKVTFKADRISSSITGTQLESVSTSSATTGTLFKYDSKTNTYIYNWSTAGLQKGTWALKAFLNFGNPATQTLLQGPPPIPTGMSGKLSLR